MSVIFKYELQQGCDGHVHLPMGSTVLHVGQQEDRLFLWAAVDESAPVAPRLFSVVGTGWRDSQMSITGYVGTVQMANGIVWHVFEVAT